MHLNIPNIDLDAGRNMFWWFERAYSASLGAKRQSTGRDLYFAASQLILGIIKSSLYQNDGLDKAVLMVLII